MRYQDFCFLYDDKHLSYTQLKLKISIKNSVLVISIHFTCIFCVQRKSVQFYTLRSLKEDDYNASNKSVKKAIIFEINSFLPPSMSGDSYAE